MHVPLELLKEKYSIEPGCAYRGKLTVNGPPSHVGIVICVKESLVYYYCMTSEEDTINGFRNVDGYAVVELSGSERAAYWPNNKRSFIYCGEAGLCNLDQDVFLEMLSSGEIKPEDKCSDSLFCKIMNAINNSITLSEAEKRRLLS